MLKRAAKAAARAAKAAARAAKAKKANAGESKSEADDKLLREAYQKLSYFSEAMQETLKQMQETHGNAVSFPVRPSGSLLATFDLRTVFNFMKWFIEGAPDPTHSAAGIVFGVMVLEISMRWIMATLTFLTISRESPWRTITRKDEDALRMSSGSTMSWYQSLVGMLPWMVT